MPESNICCQCLDNITLLGERQENAYKLVCTSFDHGTVLEYLDELHAQEWDFTRVLSQLEREGYLTSTESSQNRVRVAPKWCREYYGNGLTYCREPNNHIYK